VNRTERLLEAYRLMLRVRRFEERVAQDFRDGHIPGIVHLSIGQEAVAAGVSVNLRSDDYVASTHRAHGHLLAKGAPAKELMAEIWGKATGVCRGKGGSMHVAHLASGGLGANSIVGAGQPFAAGAAMALRDRGEDGIVVSYFGDGAVTSGSFHEGAVMAATFSLPILYVGENNGYSETTGARFHLRGKTILDALAGYGFRGMRADGMDAEAVSRAAAKLVSHVRGNGCPAVLECDTYRYVGHFEGDPMRYRTKEEVARWRERDPIELGKRRLRERGVDAETLRAIDAEATREMEEAAAFAAVSPLPEPEETLVGVYV
jgi:TPP-dependent pyruvate/acetoin dehydrogenase alpha subunit